SCSLRSYRIASGTTPFSNIWDGITLVTAGHYRVAPDVIRGCRRQQETVSSFVDSEGAGDSFGVV
ncbi:MAG TPA: hypothetical protein DCY03_06715, partial [Planctomycetaceae bacterium]|nr:hypothetical protein [Planctomycetaceae bacterium]